MPLADREMSVALLDTLFEEGPFGLAFFDPEGRYVRVSGRLAEINGLPADDHIGRTLWEVVPEMAADVLDAFNDVAAKGIPLEYEVRGETPAQPGVQRMWSVGYYPVRDGGEIVGIGAIILETTDESRAADERERLLELERTARTRAEEAERRAEFLSAAGALLDTSLDLSTTLRTLSRIVVPKLADLCIVDMFEPDSGEVRRLAVAHADPEAEELVWDLTRRWPSDENTDLGIRRVIASGTTERYGEVTDEVLAKAFPDAEHRAHVRTLELRAAVIVPLRARERTLGAMTFARVGAARGFGDRDVHLAEDLARRASLAIDNARLHTGLRRADRAQRFLSEATRLLAASLDWDTTVRTIARLAIQGIADCCSVDVLDPTGEVRRVALTHVIPAKLPPLEDVRLHTIAGEGSGRARTITTGKPLLVPRLTEDDLRRVAHDSEFERSLLELGLSSLIIVPMAARGRALGTISLGITESSRAFGPEDLALAEELASRAAVAADNARLYSERTRVAQTLQRSLMPAALPEIPGVELAVRFRAAGDGEEVGGDFYDAWPIGGDRWAAAVGDVCGKGAGAAALTALARHTLRAAARYEDGPTGVLTTLNDAIRAQSPDLEFCTAAHVWLERRAGGIHVRVALGGHLPPLVVRADGAVEPLSPPGTLLGVFAELDLGEASVELAPGDILVLYTDGVTEAGAPAETFGEERLAALLASRAGQSAEAVVAAVEQEVLALQGGRPRDDIAVLALRATG